MSKRKIANRVPESAADWINSADEISSKPTKSAEPAEEQNLSNNPKADFMTAPPPPPRVQKNVRLRKDLAEKLTREALDLTLKHGVKVHEGAIIDFLLKQRYGIDD